jgi:hypothetical protein
MKILRRKKIACFKNISVAEDLRTLKDNCGNSLNVLRSRWSDNSELALVARLASRDVSL